MSSNQEKFDLTTAAFPEIDEAQDSTENGVCGVCAQDDTDPILTQPGLHPYFRPPHSNSLTTSTDHESPLPAQSLDPHTDKSTCQSQCRTAPNWGCGLGSGLVSHGLPYATARYLIDLATVGIFVCFLLLSDVGLHQCHVLGCVCPGNLKPQLQPFGNDYACIPHRRASSLA